MKYALALALLLAAPAHAQQSGLLGRNVVVDLGIGAEAGPQYPGSDKTEVSPWFMLGGTGAGTIDQQGLAISPSVGTQGVRDRRSAPDLAALEGIDGAIELGLRLSYGVGPVTAFGTMRRGFLGHEGVTGTVGAKYRTNLSERVTLWSGVQVGYGNARFNDTYFGVTEPESVASGFPAYAPGGGINEAALTLEARYLLTPDTALVGEVQYGKLIGDAADSPVVQDEYQPSLRLGITRRFTFGF